MAPTSASYRRFRPLESGNVSRPNGYCAPPSTPAAARLRASASSTSPTSAACLYWVFQPSIRIPRPLARYERLFLGFVVCSLLGKPHSGRQRREGAAFPFLHDEQLIVGLDVEFFRLHCLFDELCDPPGRHDMAAVLGQHRVG